MKKLFIIFPLVILFCFTFSCQQGEEITDEAGAKGLSDEDVAEIRAGTDKVVQAVQSGDHATFASMFTEDGIIMPSNQPMVEGRTAIQAWSEASPNVTEFNLTIEEIDGIGKLAFVRGTYLMGVEIEGVPEPLQDTGKYINIKRKQEDGSWLIARDIWNSDLPLPSPPEKE